MSLPAKRRVSVTETLPAFPADNASLAATMAAAASEVSLAGLDACA